MTVYLENVTLVNSIYLLKHILNMKQIVLFTMSKSLKQHIKVLIYLFINYIFVNV